MTMTYSVDRRHLIDPIPGLQKMYRWLLSKILLLTWVWVEPAWFVSDSYHASGHECCCKWAGKLHQDADLGVCEQCSCKFAGSILGHVWTRLHNDCSMSTISERSRTFKRACQWILRERFALQGIKATFDESRIRKKAFEASENVKEESPVQTSNTHQVWELLCRCSCNVSHWCSWLIDHLQQVRMWWHLMLCTISFFPKAKVAWVLETFLIEKHCRRKCMQQCAV